MNTCAEHAQFCSLARSGGSSAILEQIQIDWDGPVWAAFCLCWWEVCVNKKLKKDQLPLQSIKLQTACQWKAKIIRGFLCLCQAELLTEFRGLGKFASDKLTRTMTEWIAKYQHPANRSTPSRDTCFAKLQGACRVARFFSILNRETILQLKLNWQ